MFFDKHVSVSTRYDSRLSHSRQKSEARSQKSEARSKKPEPYKGSSQHIAMPVSTEIKAEHTPSAVFVLAPHNRVATIHINIITIKEIVMSLLVTF